MIYYRWIFNDVNMAQKPRLLLRKGGMLNFVTKYKILTKFAKAEGGRREGSRWLR